MLIKMSKAIYEEMRGDLRRPHPHAWERVGFVFVAPILNNNILEVKGYLRVPDEFYIKDPTVGAHIDHRAIVLAMKRVDQNKEGVLQVHEHGGKGIPHFSQVDIDSHQDYLRSFRNANPRAPHGFLLLSEDRMKARVWLQGKNQSGDVLLFKIIGDSPKSWLMVILSRIGRVFLS
jgi:hypothetical protein